MGELEALKAVTALSLLADDIENRVDELSSLCVMSLGPVVAGTRLSEDKVVWAEDLTKWARAHRVHGAWLKINKYSTGYILASCGFIVVYIDPLQLEVRVSVVGAGGVDAVLVRDDFPEFGADLVTALAGLHVDDFSHGEGLVLTVAVWGGGVRASCALL